MNLKIAAFGLGLSFLADQCEPPPPPPPDITVMQINEDQLGGQINVPPYTRLWVKMDGRNYRPDMRFRCANMGGHLVDDICQDIDY